MIQLGDIATVRSGFPFRTRVEADPAGNALVLQMKDVGPRSGADLAGAVRTLVKAPDAHRLAVGDLVLKSRGSTHCAVIETIPGLPLVAAIPLFVLRPDPRRVSPAFLRWILNHPKTQAQLSAAAVGTYVPTVAKPAIEGLRIELPSRETQALIVKIAELAERERELLEAITRKRTDVTEHTLLRLSRSSGNTRKKKG